MKKFFLILMIIWHGSFLWASPLTPGELKKTVLYLGGGDQSPWYFLGVFYAIDAYKIPVDSIVASSWGAWVSALWMEGFSPDAIQKLFLDPEVKPFVGQEQLSLNRFFEKSLYCLLGMEIFPLYKCAFIESDTAGFLKWSNGPKFGFSYDQKCPVHFRIQESLSQR